VPVKSRRSFDDQWTAGARARKNTWTAQRHSWIAATAIAHGLPLVTQDDDFDAVPGLELVKL
jgi:predicted nucleic acid-binding protein